MKGLNISQVARPTKVEEAVSLLDQWGPSARLVAGNTTIYELARQGGLVDVDKLIDVSNLGLSYVEAKDGILYAGSATTFIQLAKSELLLAPSVFTLRETAAKITPPQVRNMGTLGGAISSGIPFYDMPTTILALGSRIKAVSAKGEREIPADDFFVDYFVTALDSSELVVEVQTPLQLNTGTAFVKIGRTSVDFAVVNCSAKVRLNERGDRIEQARIALGAVATKPIRTLSVEKALVGSDVSRDKIAVAAKSAAEEIDPSPSIHASPGYKKKIIPVVIRDAVLTAAERARS